MKVIYVWDALCGWCYGFGTVLEAFVARHPELELELVSGGLMPTEMLTVKAHPYIPEANQRITNTYGVRFGSAYEQAIRGKGLRVSSFHTAWAFGLLRKQLPKAQHLALAKAMQTAMYAEGRSLSELDTYRPILRQFGLSETLLLPELGKALRKDDTMHPDFSRARELEAEVYPTLLLEHQGELYLLSEGAALAEEVELRYQQIIAD